MAVRSSTVRPEGFTLPDRILPRALNPVWPGPGARMTDLMEGYSSIQPSSMALEALITTTTLSKRLVTSLIMASSRVVGSR